MAKGLLVAAGIGGMGFMIKRTLDSIDATAKLSDALGIQTERLIGLRHAANIAGVANEALDKSLAMFVRRLGEVKLGTGEAKEGLKLLGLTADELISKSPADAIGVVADKIKLLEGASLKGQAAYLLFGRSGQQLLNMLEMGSVGLREMQEEAERMGLTFNRIDAAKVEMANDAFTRLKGVITGVVQSLTIELAPVLEAVSVKLVDISTRGESAGEKARAVFARLGRTLAIVSDVLGGIKGILQIIIGLVQGALALALKGVLLTVSKFLLTFEDINNRIAATKIGKKLGIDILDLSDKIAAVENASKVFDEAAKRNLSRGAKNITDAFFGEGVKRYDRLMRDAEKRAEAISKNLIRSVDATEKIAAAPAAAADKFDPGKFAVIRSAFVDIAALSGSIDTSQPILRRQLEEAEKSNVLLEKLTQTDITGTVLV